MPCDLVLGADDAGQNGAGRCLIAGDAVEGSVADLEPRRAGQSEARERDGAELVVGERRRPRSS